MASIHGNSQSAAIWKDRENEHEIFKNSSHSSIKPLCFYDNGKPHSTRITPERILDLSWFVLSHPPFSLDLAPSDFHLFHSLQNVLNFHYLFILHPNMINYDLGLDSGISYVFWWNIFPFYFNSFIYLFLFRTDFSVFAPQRPFCASLMLRRNNDVSDSCFIN